MSQKAPVSFLGNLFSYKTKVVTYKSCCFSSNRRSGFLQTLLITSQRSPFFQLPITCFSFPLGLSPSAASIPKFLPTICSSSHKGSTMTSSALFSLFLFSCPCLSSLLCFPPSNPLSFFSSLFSFFYNRTHIDYQKHLNLILHR